MQTFDVPQVVPQETEVVGVVAPAPARGLRWWAVLPLALAGLAAMIAVPTLIDVASSGQANKVLTKTAVRTEAQTKQQPQFVDPEGLYTMETGADWEPLSPYTTGEERFAVSEPVGGYTPEVVIDSGSESFGDAEQEARFYAETLSSIEYEILDTGVVDGSDGALGFLEWRDPDGARGYTVVTTSGDTWILAELLAPPNDYEAILEDVKPLLHTLRPTPG